MPSSTPEAKFISKVRKDDGEAIAAAALAYWMRLPINLNQYDNLKGAMSAFAFETGAKVRKEDETQALEELRVEWEKKFQSIRDTLVAETATHKKLNADGGQLISSQDSAYKELIAKQSNAVIAFLAKSQDQWSELRRIYDAELAVKSPINYWTRKAKTHFRLSWAYAVVAAGAAGLSLYFLIPEVKDMMQPPKGVTEPDKWHPEYWRFAVLIASAFFCVWVVRILVRLLLSNIHLLTDAKERVTMVQTYLALLRRGKFEKDERMFILQTLFRPTPTGIVKDDAVPLTVVEGITKLGHRS